MHFSFIANIALSAAALVWLLISAYYLYFSTLKHPKITRRVSTVLAIHGILISILALSNLLSLPQLQYLLNVRTEIPHVFSGIVALTCGLFSIGWFLPKALPSYSQREKELETSLSDTTSHLKSLYSISQQGVLLVCTETFKIQQANNEAKRVLGLVSRKNSSQEIPEVMKNYLANWLKHGRSSNILNMPYDKGTLSLHLDISSFAMEKSSVLLVQFKDIETIPDEFHIHENTERSFEVQLIERFDELLNIHAKTSSDLVFQLGKKLSTFNLFNCIAVLESDNQSEIFSLKLLNNQEQQLKTTVAKSEIEARILDNDSGIQFYSRITELRLPNTLTEKLEANSSLAVLNLDDQLDNKFSIILFTHKANKLNSAILALVDQLRNQICFRINQLSHTNVQKQNALLQKQLTTIIESSANAIILTNTDFMIEYINPKLCETSGYEEQQLLGRPFSILCPIEDNPLIHKSIRDHVETKQPWHGEVVQRDRQGMLRWSNLQLSYMHDELGEVSHYILHLEDRTELYQAQDEINQLTHFDPLTNLPNRNHLALRIKSALEENNQKQILALMYLDLDGFKHINDSLGHHNGDRLLKTIAERLQELLSPNDTLARLGGDEFAILLPNVLVNGSILGLVNNILETVSLPTLIADNSVVLTGSIGITLYPQDAQTAEELQKNADLAMYQAKKDQGNSYHIYTPDLNTKAVKRLDLEHRLRRAIQNEELDVHFQPQVNIHTGDIIGAEALVRWFDPERGAISPGQFIPLAEETGLIADLGSWVIKQACCYTKQFLPHVEGDFKLAINLSAYQFKRPDQLIQELDQALLENALPAQCLELELTESMLMDNVQSTKETLKLLHHNGISLAIDDFGTGYSSLAYLKEFPIDKLKIDRSFIKDINHNKDDAAITSAVIAMAQKLGLSVLAEGVENSSQLQFLLEHNCDSMQGFYFSKALPAEEFIELLTEEQQSPDLLKGLQS
ncbi:putative bifunctional diguanylate cyclase/phosphodiesterase [Litoribacillus peritrichatus]|uniref:EAL domain-containing protein n=1 Tax=Litoribacillus peritrichatus TaxID=718191 RepID=A0ABP7MXL3_9GAMM